jgi:hypothetical protein
MIDENTMPADDENHAGEDAAEGSFEQPTAYDNDASPVGADDSFSGDELMGIGEFQVTDNAVSDEPSDEPDIEDYEAEMAAEYGAEYGDTDGDDSDAEYEEYEEPLGEGEDLAIDIDTAYEVFCEMVDEDILRPLITEHNELVEAHEELLAENAELREAVELLEDIAASSSALVMFEEAASGLSLLERGRFEQLCENVEVDPENFDPNGFYEHVQAIRAQHFQRRPIKDTGILSLDEDAVLEDNAPRDPTMRAITTALRTFNK